MSYKKQKGWLKSFTLTEIIISLAISAVLVSLVVKLFTFFSETQSINNKKLSDYEEIINTEHLLSELMEESDSVHYTNESLDFYFENNQEKTISFYDSFIIYNDSDLSDTLHLNAGEIESEFHTSAPSLLKSFSFQVSYSNQILPIKIIKEYEGAVIVNSQINIDEN